MTAVAAGATDEGDRVTASLKGAWGAAAIAAGLLATPAAADGYPPFFGYSDYFGGPTAYFTPETDVQQATRPEGGYFGFGTRTYYRGGPFWRYQPARTVRAVAVRKGYKGPRRATLRTKG